MTATLPGVAQPRTVKRRFGLPFDGFISSVPAHLCPPNKAWGSQPSAVRTSNMIFDPIEGKFFRRAGILNVGGTTGILENGTGELTVARARRLFSLDSPSLADGYPTHAVLYTEEGNHKGCVYLRSTNGSDINYTLGQEFDATNHYPGTTAATMNFKVVPYYRTSGAGGSTEWGRLNTTALRAWPFSGSRNCLEVGEQVCFPDLDTIPMRWNKRFNDSSASGTENLRLFPLGHLPPPPMLTVTTGTLTAGGSWLAADLFYYSVAFEFADGSISPWAVPRDVNDDLASGLMRVNIDSGTPSANAYSYLTISGIPLGPDGCVARRIYRTPKRAGGATASTEAPPSPLDLRLTARIPNNTQTVYVDSNGNDLSLIAEDLEREFAKNLCPPARYLWAADNRIFAGYTKRNPAAIILWPNVNATDDDASILTNSYQVTLSGGTLTLYKDASTTAFSNIGTISIQALVDRINATTGSGGGKWYAAVAPGADPFVPCGTAAGNNNALASTTSIDVGDTAGRVRAFSSSLPLILYHSTGYLSGDSNYPGFATEKRRFFFTMGGPGMPTNAANSWSAHANNYRTAPESWGILMGGAPLLNGCLVFYSKAIALFRNTTSGKSGLDKDFILTDLFPNLGCIAYDSIVHGNGWAGCLTPEGFMVFDGTPGGKVCISSDVWNPVTRQGEWAYEVAQSIAAVASDSDGSHFHAKVMGGEIVITYRSHSGVTIPDRRLHYNFSASAGQSGLAEVLKGDGSTWGWSPPLIGTLSVVGEVRKSDGAHRYGCIEDNAGATSNGRVDEFDTGTDDNGSDIEGNVWCAMDLAEDMRKKRAQRAWVVYKANSSGITLHVRRSNGSSSVTATGGGLPLPTTGSGDFSRTLVPLLQNARGPCVGLQIRLKDDGTGDPASFYGVELDTIITSAYG